MPRALAIGEALIDEFPDRRLVAGAPLHVLAHLAALGWEAAMISRVGDDEDGREVVAAMRSAQIGTGLVEIDPALPTGTTAITLLPGGAHRFEVRHPAAWDAIVGPDPVPDHDVLIFGTLALRDARSRAAVTRMATTPALIVVDLNLRAPHYDRDTVSTALEQADLVKATSDEEAAVIRLLDIDSMFVGRTRWVCITRGEAGATLRNRVGEEWSVPAVPVDVVDAVGAGDAFLAGLIDGMVPEGDPLEALTQATRLAADTLRRRGGMPVPSDPGSRNEV